jgi:hypothetical protein
MLTACRSALTAGPAAVASISITTCPNRWVDRTILRTACGSVRIATRTGTIPRRAVSPGRTGRHPKPERSARRAWLHSGIPRSSGQPRLLASLLHGMTLRPESAGSRESKPIGPTRSVPSTAARSAPRSEPRATRATWTISLRAGTQRSALELPKHRPTSAEGQRTQTRCGPRRRPVPEKHGHDVRQRPAASSTSGQRTLGSPSEG